MYVYVYLTLVVSPGNHMETICVLWEPNFASVKPAAVSGTNAVVGTSNMTSARYEKMILVVSLA